MRRMVLLVIILVFALGACSTAPAQLGLEREALPPDTPEVILISIDGYRAEYLARGENPVLDELAAHGVRARWMVPSFPTVTEPNHYTLLTGMYPDQNGIVNNDIADREIQPEHFEMTRYYSTVDPRWWSAATPLWLSVQRNGMRTGEVSWPSGDIRIDDARPDLHLNGQQAGATDEKSADVLRWLDLPSDQRPRFIMLHYDLVDGIGHRYGPDSPQMDAALREVDGAIGRLVYGLKQGGLYATTDLVIVSDHGMAELPPGHEIYLDDIIDRRAVGLVALGAMAGVDPHRGIAGAEAAAALLAQAGSAAASALRPQSARSTHCVHGIGGLGNCYPLGDWTSQVRSSRQPWLRQCGPFNACHLHRRGTVVPRGHRGAAVSQCGCLFVAGAHPRRRARKGCRTLRANGVIAEASRSPAWSAACR